MQILRMKALTQKVGLSRSEIYFQIKRGDFPAPLKLGERASGWLLSDVDGWIESKRRKAVG